MLPSPRKPVNLEPDELDGDFDAINHKKEVTSSIWRHEFENGRRVGLVNLVLLSPWHLLTLTAVSQIPIREVSPP